MPKGLCHPGHHHHRQGILDKDQLKYKTLILKRKCLFAHSVCANFSLIAHSVCANFGLIAHSPVYSVILLK